MQSASQIFRQVFTKAYAREHIRQAYGYTDDQQEAFLRELAFFLWWYGDNSTAKDYALLCTPGDEKADLLLGHHLLRPTPSGQLTFQHHRVRDYFLALEIRRIMSVERHRIPEVFVKRLPEGTVSLLGEAVTLKELTEAWDLCGASHTTRGNLVALLLSSLRMASTAGNSARTAALEALVHGRMLKRADLSRLRIEMFDLRGWEFRDCDLSGTLFVLSDIRDFRREGCTEEGTRFEECEQERPQLVEKRGRVLEVVRRQVGLFAIDAERHMWRDKIAQTDVERAGRFNAEAMAALQRAGLIVREQGERGAWFLRFAGAGVLRDFWRDNSAQPALDEAIEALVKRSSI